MSPDGARALDDRLLRNGVPHLAADDDPREDTLTRLQPVLAVLFLLALGPVLRPDWPWWQRVPAVVAGAGLAAAGLVVANLLRRRPPLARPQRVGFAEALVVVLTPALASLLPGDDLDRVAWIAPGSLGVAALLYPLASLGVPRAPALPGPARLEGLADAASVAVRALPPLLASRARGTPAEPLVARGVAPAVPSLVPVARLDVTVAPVAALAVRVLVAAVALGDPRNRAEFLDDLLERFGRVLAAWAHYRGALAAR